MNLKVKFSETDKSFKMRFAGTEKSFKPNFGTVYNVSDDSFQKGFSAGESEGYEKGQQEGYADGYSQGKADGYNEGNADGYKTGYDKGSADGHESGLTEGYNNGYSVGKTEGYDDGYTKGDIDGYDRGNEDGKQAQYDIFWDAIQNGGAKTNYNWHFSGDFWTDDNFKPKYPFGNTAVSLSYAFHSSKNIKDVSEHYFKTSAPTYMFYSSNVERIGIVEVTQGSLLYAFGGCIKLHTIEELRLPNEETNTVALTGAFTSCVNLTEIRITGFINQALSITSTQLSRESLLSIINALSDRTGLTSAKLTIGTTNRKKLTSDELSQITSKGWTIA